MSRELPGLTPGSDYADMATPAVAVTREPRMPVSWPRGHVAVEVTGEEHEECLRVRVHGVDHLLHTSTAVELFRELGRALGEWEEVAAPALHDQPVVMEHVTTLTAARQAGRAVRRIAPVKGA